MTAHGLPVNERFALHLAKGTKGCINWTGSQVLAGYGQFSINGRIYLAHRVAWELEKGKIPKGMHLLHTCGNKLCCNVKHLVIATPENRQKMLVAKRKQQTHCKNGHPFDKKNTYVIKSGTRVCRTCQDQNMLRYYERKTGKGAK